MNVDRNQVKRTRESSLDLVGVVIAFPFIALLTISLATVGVVAGSAAAIMEPVALATRKSRVLATKN